MARIIQGNTTSTELLDTNIYNNITADSSAPVNPNLTQVSTKSAGIVKLVNRFLKLMYTLKGSNYLDKTEGTRFTNIFNTNIQDVVVAQSRVQDAIDDAVEQIIKIQTLQGVPNTERLTAAYISKFAIDEAGTVYISITLEVVTGSQTTVQLPSTLTIG